LFKRQSQAPTNCAFSYQSDDSLALSIMAKT